MLEIGVQTHNVIMDENPDEGFKLLHDTGFTCCDFSLNFYLKNTDLYKFELNKFFDKSVDELKEFFRPHKEAAERNGIRFHPLHGCPFYRDFWHNCCRFPQNRIFRRPDR